MPHAGHLKVVDTDKPLDFGKVLVGTARELPAQWVNAGTQAVELDGSSTTNGAFPAVAVPLKKLGAGDKMKISLIFSPSSLGPAAAKTGFFSAVWSTLNKTDQPKIESLALKGEGIGEIEMGGAAGLGVSGGAHDDGQIDHGEVFVGDVSTLEYAIVNRSAAPITVAMKWFGNPGVFGLAAPGPVKIAKHGDAVIKHTFKPALAQAYQATLLFINKDKPQNWAGVLVQGTGKLG